MFEIFSEIMIQNGYLEYKEDEKYEIFDNTKDYYTGKK